MKSNSSQRRSGKRFLVGTCLSAALVAGVGLPHGASAGSLDRGFIATAEASGMYVRYGIPGFLVVENFIDGGGPVSQALLGSDGTSQSFASLPYPGPTAIGYPGLAALVLGSAPPGYPLYASASDPVQPEQTVSDPSGAYNLSAKANDTEAGGDARFSPAGKPGETAPATHADSRILVEEGKVSATAVSLAQGVVAGPLSLGTVRSTSVSTYQKGDDQPVTKTDLRIEGGKAGDTTFSFGPEGLKVAQQGVPLPAASGLEAMNQALEPAGLSIHFAESRAIEGGAVAGAFEIVSTADVPGAGAGTLRIRFGGAMSFISLGAVEGAPLEEEVVHGSDPGTHDSGGAPPGSTTDPVPAGSSSDATNALTAPVRDSFGQAGSAFSSPPTDARFTGGGSDSYGTDFTTGDALAGQPSDESAYDANASVAAAPVPRPAYDARTMAAAAQLRSLESTSYLSALLGIAALLVGGVAVWTVARRHQPWTA